MPISTNGTPTPGDVERSTDGDLLRPFAHGILMPECRFEG
jgi:hypothetical protein